MARIRIQDLPVVGGKSDTGEMTDDQLDNVAGGVATTGTVPTSPLFSPLILTTRPKIGTVGWDDGPNCVAGVRG